MTLETAEARSIIRGTVGSTIHGLALEGTDDRDEMGICIEPIHDAIGVGSPFEQFIYRSAAERDGRQDAPSQPGDLDLTIYGLRKYVKLALSGNPTVIILLFIPSHQLIRYDARGAALQELAPLIISRKAGKAFLGYLHAQRQRLTGERGQMRVNRNDLKELHGYDTKYAMHMLRLGFQGVELLETGRLSLPMPEEDRAWLMGVRRGEVSLQECLTKAGELEHSLRDLVDASPLPALPDSDAVEAWMIRQYIRSWSADRKTQDIMEDADALHQPYVHSM